LIKISIDKCFGENPIMTDFPPLQEQDSQYITNVAFSINMGINKYATMPEIEKNCYFYLTPCFHLDMYYRIK